MMIVQVVDITSGYLCMYSSRFIRHAFIFILFARLFILIIFSILFYFILFLFFQTHFMRNCKSYNPNLHMHTYSMPFPSKTIVMVKKKKKRKHEIYL